MSRKTDRTVRRDALRAQRLISAASFAPPSFCSIPPPRFANFKFVDHESCRWDVGARLRDSKEPQAPEAAKLKREPRDHSRASLTTADSRSPRLVMQPRRVRRDGSTVLPAPVCSVFPLRCRALVAALHYLTGVSRHYRRRRSIGVKGVPRSLVGGTQRVDVINRVGKFEGSTDTSAIVIFFFSIVPPRRDLVPTRHPPVSQSRLARDCLGGGRKSLLPRVYVCFVFFFF